MIDEGHDTVAQAVKEYIDVELYNYLVFRIMGHYLKHFILLY